MLRFAVSGLGVRALTVLAAVVVAGCDCGRSRPVVECYDNDKDGYDTCHNPIDCNDDDPAIHPGATEICDGKDNDCDGAADEGCSCTINDPPIACGEPGSLCKQVCSPDGKLSTCMPEGMQVIDTQTDPVNCGMCGHVCPTPVNAKAICVKGVCSRSCCSPGYFDLDGATTYGCETKCAGTSCTDPSGKIFTLSSPALAECGLTLQSLASGSSHGAAVQTSASHTNMGILGESTPPAAGGASEQTGSAHKNISGFTSALHQP